MARTNRDLRTISAKGVNILLKRESKHWRILRGHFLTGLAVLAPLFITGWMLLSIFNFLDSRIRGYFEDLFQLEIPPYGLGVCVTLLAVLFVGVAARNFVGGRILSFFESLLLRVPVANRLYRAMKQIVSAFVGQDKTVFEKAVLLEYPRKGLYCMGFLTYPDKISFPEHSSLPKMRCIFIPTTPNPTSGFLLLVPENELFVLNMTVEDALKMIISGGVVLPEVVDVESEPNWTVA